MKITQPKIDEVLRLLAHTPIHISTLSSDIPNDEMVSKPEPKTWSANEVLAHLRACADVWGADIQSILERENPSLPNIHPRARLKEMNYDQLEFKPSFQAFCDQRAQLLESLTPLSIEEWGRTATIGGRRHTVFSQVRRLALHEAGHYEQFENLLTT
jgi:hypothetical protein